MNVTIQSKSIPNCRLSGDAATLLFAARERFVTSDGEIIAQGSFDNQDWYISVDLTIVSGSLVIPAIELPTTDDSDTPNAKWMVRLLDAGGSQAKFFLDEFSLRSDLGLTPDWIEIIETNQGSNPAFKDGFVTTAQVIALINSLGAGGGGGGGGATALSGLSDVTIASPQADDVFQYKGGKWVNRTLAQLKTDLALAAANISDFAANVRSTVLTGLSTATGTAITVADTVLSALGKLQKQASDNATNISTNSTNLSAHTANTSNPHNTTKAQIGLGNVDNTSDSAKPISALQQAALDLKADLVAGKIPTSQLPAISLGESFTVASQAAMLALTAQIGDVAIRTDQSNAKYLLLGTDATLLSNWISMAATGAVSSVNGQTGVVVLGKSDIGLSNVPNTDATARANHTGTQTADTITDGTTNKAFTATEKTKLAGIATGATANDTDANLKARANHTGTQTASTISDFAATVLATVLTGLSTATGTAITVADTVLSALGKLQAQITGYAAATVTFTNKTIAGGSNTISGITEAMLSTSDVTTLDVSTSKHGFAPKAPNDSTKFLRGDGTWAVPSGGGGGSSAEFANFYTTNHTFTTSESGSGIQGAIGTLPSGAPAGTHFYFSSIATLGAPATVKFSASGVVVYPPNLTQNAVNNSTLTLTNGLWLIVCDGSNNWILSGGGNVFTA